LERKLIGKLQLRSPDPITAKGRLECHIAPLIGLSKTSAGYSMAAGLLQKMEKDGVIAVESSGANLREVRLVETDETADEAKKSDEQVPSPAKESLFKDDNKMPSEAEADRVVGEQLIATPAEKRKLELLNLALVILQDASDSDGNVMGATAPVIERGLKGQGIIVTASAAAQLNWLLGQLNRRTLSGPRKKAVQYISQDGKEISLQELRSITKATAKPKTAKDEKAQPSIKTEQPAPVKTEVTKVPEVSKSKAVQSAPTGNKPPLQEVLADIIEDLRKQLREKNDSISSLEKRLKDGGEAAQQVIKKLNEDLDAANDENRKLREQLTQTNTPTPRVEKILAELAKETN
jgi:hypothetical protein